MDVCTALHPDLGIQCEMTEDNHPNHSAFQRGWHPWPNGDFKPQVKPKDLIKDLASRIHEQSLGEDRHGHSEADCDTPAQRFVYGLLVEAGHRGLTHEELIDKAHQESSKLTDSSIRTRCRELVDKGMVCASGNYRLTSSGNKSIVWMSRR